MRFTFPGVAGGDARSNPSNHLKGNTYTITALSLLQKRGILKYQLGRSHYGFDVDRLCAMPFLKILKEYHILS